MTSTAKRRNGSGFVKWQQEEPPKLKLWESFARIQTNMNTVDGSQNGFQQHLDLICLQSHVGLSTSLPVYMNSQHLEHQYHHITPTLQKTNCYNWCSQAENILSIKHCQSCRLPVLSHSLNNFVCCRTCSFHVYFSTEILTTFSQEPHWKEGSRVEKSLSC